MTHWTFVIAAYAVTFGGTALLLVWSWLSMRKAESAAEAMKRR